jgi:D-glycero-D-manno-heptose 1,7-bisphosphate phosphatase
MSKIKQAAILCGGLGTRLRPLTDNLPKPMVEVNGKPFLLHLLNQLSEQGINEFLLLTGYLGEKVVEYFGDGSLFGFSIAYSHGPVEWDTGRRIWEAREYLDEQFLLMYSDNFVQFNLEKLLQKHQDLCVPMTLLVARKENGNIKISKNGRIQAYDKARKEDGFNYVEIGYMAIKRDEILNFFPQITNFPNFNFSLILEKLAPINKIGCVAVYDDYHSISDPKRLVLMSKYLEPKKIILIDRDGTINQKAPKGEYITKWSEFKWIIETIEAMKWLARRGYKFIVITNQAGVARQMIMPVDLEEIHSKMIDSLAREGVEVLNVYMCPDHWNDDTFMRKPSPGMFFQAAREFYLRMDHSLYIGDDERDCEAALNAGCGMLFMSKEKLDHRFKENPVCYHQTSQLTQAVEYIHRQYMRWDNSQ